MHTIASARKWAIEEFKAAGVESPMLSADLLLGFVLGWQRVRVLSHPEHLLAPKDYAYFQSLIGRRVKGEPLQYLLGEQEFYGLLFRVTPEVLIPRPETELLVEEALRLMKESPPAVLRFLDVGTGSGCIAVSIARDIPVSAGWAIDISADALRIARENAVRHGVAQRIQFIQSDLLECFSSGPVFDFVLSNPPYVPFDDFDSLPREVRDHEPHAALFGGASGLGVYRRAIPGISSRIAPGGFLLLELGAGQAEKVSKLVEMGGLCVQRILDDLQGIPRCLVARKLPRREHG